jgi:hypothetical protein
MRVWWRGWIVAVTLTAAPWMAAASSSSQGYAALGVVVGVQSPLLDVSAKQRLEALIADQAPGGAAIEVTAKSVTCRAGDVDIAAFSCALDFGSGTVSLSGRAAHEVFATLQENGVPGDGAAGTVYEAVQRLQCRLDPREIAQKGGGGASCGYEQGP